MILTCPACATRFLVPDTAFSAGPRRVRCGKCRHDWLAELPPEAPQTLDERAAATTDSILPHEPVEFAKPELRPIPHGSNLPVRRRKLVGGLTARLSAVPPVVRHLGLLIGLAALTAGLSFALYGSANGQLEIGHLLHHAAAPNLLIENVATHYVEHAAEGDDSAAKSWALVVEGNVRNGGGDTAAIPPLLLETRDAHGQLLGMARPSVQQAQLAPGTVTGFSATLTDVTDKVAAVTVQFGAQDDGKTPPPAAPAEKQAEKQTDAPVAAPAADNADVPPEAVTEAAPPAAAQTDTAHP